MLKISSLFEAYITNLGKYNEGRLVGETLKFPATTEEVQALLKRIGVDGVRYEEIFITSFDGDVLGLYDHLGEYESIDELNHLAHVLSDLDQSDIEKFEAVIDSGEYTGSVHDLINLAQNLDCYDFYPGIDSEEALGRVYIEEMEMLDVPDNVLPYFDFEAYGRDVRINDGGHFAPGGYVFNNGGSFVERYHGMENIPPEHRIFAYTANLFLLNKTDKTVMFSVDDASVNGFMADPFYATSVSAGKCAFSSMAWSDTTLEENGITEVEEIEVLFRAYDADDFMGEDFANEVITLNP